MTLSIPAKTQGSCQGLIRRKVCPEATPVTVWPQHRLWGAPELCSEVPLMWPSVTQSKSVPCYDPSGLCPVGPALGVFLVAFPCPLPFSPWRPRRGCLLPSTTLL